MVAMVPFSALVQVTRLVDSSSRETSPQSPPTHTRNPWRDNLKLAWFFPYLLMSCEAVDRPLLHLHCQDGGVLGLYHVPGLQETWPIS